MREIKFRQWCKDGFWWSGLNQDGSWTAPLRGLEIQQFTGLHDSEGNEIWEGDIINDLSNTSHDRPNDIRRAKVNYGDFMVNDFSTSGYGDAFGFYVEYYPLEVGYSTGCRELWQRLAACSVVIGNIYENPELLK